MKHNPCHQDCRVAFSPLFSIINIIISTICLVMILGFQTPNNKFFTIICVVLVLHLLGILFTLMVIFYDKIFCCCCCGECCLGAEERMVYDPSQPEVQLLWTNGKVQSYIISVYVRPSVPSPPPLWLG